MADYKKGDVCVVLVNCENWQKGDIVIVDEDDTCPYVTQQDKRRAIRQKELALHNPKEQYTPLTPKVGDKFRVVKEIGQSQAPVGWVGTIDRVDSGTLLPASIMVDDTHGMGNWIEGHYFTTEYLEPVGEECPNLPIATAEIEEGQESFTLPEGHTGGTVRFQMNSTLRLIEEFKSYKYETKEPIKQPITKTIMNIYRKARMSKDDRKLYKANYINEDGTPTGQGKEANDFINWDNNKKALVEMAEADIKEVEDAK